VIPVRRDEELIHPAVYQSLKRAFELRVRRSVFKLKNVEIALLLVEVEAIDAVIVATKRDLVERLFAGDVMFPLKIKEAEIVLSRSSTRGSKVRLRLINMLLSNHGKLRG
jgi:putative ribosome biogenesis GTPase RsgA